MPETPFFRLLKTPIDDKGDALAAQIAALNAVSPLPLPLAGEGPGERADTFTLDPGRGLGGIGVNQDNPPPAAVKTVTLVSPTDAIDRAAYSFARDARETDPNREQYDVLAESWCLPGPALCGNFVDLGRVDFDQVTSFPAAGYVDDCREVDPGHVFISRNRDGSHTVFMITRHVSDNWQGHCRHTIDLKYRRLD